jgi:uncharacterized protein YjgD (DUF1641 family)
MASPIEFKPRKVDPREELQLRLQAAPTEHAESLLAALNLLEAAHRKGFLGLAEGAISSKDAVFAKLAEYAKQPRSISALRNLLAFGKLIGSINPGKLDVLAKSASDETQKPPSLLALLTRMRKPDARRGLSIALELLGALGSK